MRRLLTVHCSAFGCVTPRKYGSLSRADALVALNIIARKSDGSTGVTLGGLLALNIYPQRFFPRLTVTFACFSGVSKAEAGGVKYIESQNMTGPIPAVLMDPVDAARRNIRTGRVLVDGLRRDVPYYPLGAVREAVCNALMHRDYSPMGRGAQVQVNLYADRLEVLSPGGLYGAVTVDALGELGASSTCNQYLPALLEVVPYQGEVESTAHSESILALLKDHLVGISALIVQNKLSLCECVAQKALKSMADRGLLNRDKRGRQYWYLQA